MRGERGTTNCMVLSGGRGWVLAAETEEWMEGKKGHRGGDDAASL